MDLITPPVAAAGAKAAGRLTAALIGQYRPTGVPRLGSKEDRAFAYRRLLDASTHAWQFPYLIAHLRNDAGRAGDKLALGQLPRGWDASAELIAALNHVRLCGTAHVIQAGERIVEATIELDTNASSDAVQEQADVVVARQKAYIEACRHDLSYVTRWWHVKRRWQERKLRRSAGRASGQG